MKIAVTGATGFIGHLLLENLKTPEKIIAIRRSSPKESIASENIEWRTGDLFSLLQLEEALVGVDVAIYLIHSMLPSARLMQSRFENADLLLADNFARACSKMNVKRIIYLGGLIPETGKLSRHLQSRLEVEHTLASKGVAVTALRAGLILGAEGSSFQMLYTLVKRLPVMICPRWTRSLTQPIAVDDVLAMLQFCVDHPETAGHVLEIGGSNILSYRDLMKEVALAMNKKRFFINVPFFTPGLSRLWVRLITGASKNLVYPLIESLKHEMVAKQNALITWAHILPMNIRDAVQKSLLNIHPTLRKITNDRVESLKKAKYVRSIQRLPIPKGKDAAWIAAEYFRWLPKFMTPLVRVEMKTENLWSFTIPLINFCVLTLKYSPERSAPDRQLFYINGGWLARYDLSRNGRLEFREVLDGKSALAAIHDFRPRLSWYLYNYTQALAHLWVMHSFSSHLKKIK